MDNLEELKALIEQQAARIAELEAAASAQADAEPVACWAAYNGVSLEAFFKTEDRAKEYAAEMQKNHDLSGSLAAFRVKPLYTRPAPAAAQESHEAVTPNAKPASLYFRAGRGQGLQEAMYACKREHLEEPGQTADDIAYTAAVNDCIRAIDRLLATAPAAASSQETEQPCCQACGDGITAHDPGVCGNCFAMKYRDAAPTAQGGAQDRDAVRREALEEAAALAEQWGEARMPDHGGNALRNCAAAIRALSQKPVSGE